MNLTADQINAFDRDGYVVIPSVISADTIAAARRSAIDLMFEDSGQPLVWAAELGKDNSQMGRMRPRRSLLLLQSPSIARLADNRPRIFRISSSMSPVSARMSQSCSTAVNA